VTRDLKEAVGTARGMRTSLEVVPLGEAVTMENYPVLERSSKTAASS